MIFASESQSNIERFSYFKNSKLFVSLKMLRWLLIFTILTCQHFIESQSFQISYTHNKVKCMTACVIYKDYEYNEHPVEYCYTDWSHWDYCTVGLEIAPQYFTALKNGQITDCTSLCDTYGYDYTWCLTGVVGSNTWDYCSRDNDHSVYLNRCTHECHTIDGEFQCLIQRGELEACSTNAVDSAAFCEIDSSILGSYGQYTNVGFEKCKRRAKRSAFECDVRNRGVEAMAQTYERIFQSRRIVIATPSVSVTSYVTIRVPSVTHLTLVNELTLVVRASIYPRHLNQQREQIPSYIGVRMDEMNRLPGDEQGHLVAASLGGPSHDFNFVPQTSNVNRRYLGESYWYTIEGEIRQFLRQPNAGRVDWTVVVGYNLAVSRRPTGFGLQFFEYDNAGNLVHDSGNCFFTNDPEGGCII